MLKFLIYPCLCFQFINASVVLADTPEVIALWPGDAPGESKAIGPERTLPDKSKAPNPIIRLTDVATPVISIYRAEKPNTARTAVIVCPGGGYNILAYNHEGTEICEWLNSIGVTAILLKYRVPRRAGLPPHQLPLMDAQRAVRLVRAAAERLEIAPDRIGMLGFSAGGHLTVMAGTHFRDKTYQPIDDADTISARPDFLIPIYPAYLLDKTNPAQLDPAVTIDKETPPTFMAITYDDGDRAIGTALTFIALKNHGVPAELHIYHKGGHGYGMRASKHPVSHWPQRCGEWMSAMGYLE